jgi:GxxExxY protein
VQAQLQIPIIYKNCPLNSPLRLDLLVGNKIIIEIKATEKEVSVHRAQVLTYLRLTGYKLGLVLNFGQERLVDGITRVSNFL